MRRSFLSKKLSILFGLSIFLVFSSVFSDQKEVVQPLNKSEKIIHENKKAVQDFELEGFSQLKVQFRYVGGKLKSIYLYNDGRPVELKLVEQSQVLGRGDNWEIRAPNVKHIILRVDAYNPEVSTHLDSPFIDRSFVFCRSKNGLYTLHFSFNNGQKVKAEATK